MLVSHLVASFARYSKPVWPFLLYFSHVSIRFLVFPCCVFLLRLEIAQEWTSVDCSQTWQCLSQCSDLNKATWYGTARGWDNIPPLFCDTLDDLYQTQNTRYCSLTRLWALGPNAYRGMEHSCSAPHSELVKVLWVWTEWGMWTLTRSYASRWKRKLIKVQTCEEEWIWGALLYKKRWSWHILTAPEVTSSLLSQGKHLRHLMLFGLSVV